MSETLSGCIITIELKGLTSMLETYLDSLSSDSVAPGGGFAAGVSGAQGVALLLMATNLSKKCMPQDKFNSTVKTLEALKAESMKLAKKDQTEFEALMSSFKLPKDSPGRADVIQGHYRSCAEVPLDLSEALIASVPVARELLESGNKHLFSDVYIGLLNIKTAIESCYYNIEANLGYIKDQAFVDDVRSRYNQCREKVATELDGMTKQ